MPYLVNSSKMKKRRRKKIINKCLLITHPFNIYVGEAAERVLYNPLEKKKNISSSQHHFYFHWEWSVVHDVEHNQKSGVSIACLDNSHWNALIVSKFVSVRQNLLCWWLVLKWLTDDSQNRGLIGMNLLPSGIELFSFSTQKAKHGESQEHKKNRRS